MAKQGINYAEFDSNKKELDMIFNKIIQTLEDVNTTCSSIVSSEIWNGQAAEYYTKKSGAVCDNFSDINYELKSVINYTDIVMNNYKEFERNIMGSISN